MLDNFHNYHGNKYFCHAPDKEIIIHELREMTWYLQNIFGIIRIEPMTLICGGLCVGCWELN